MASAYSPLSHDSIHGNLGRGDFHARSLIEFAKALAFEKQFVFQDL